MLRPRPPAPPPAPPAVAAPTRRAALVAGLAALAAPLAPPARAGDGAAATRYVSPRGWGLTPPPGFDLTSKPGADALWTPAAGGRASLGVTVSPVRLQSLTQFGDVDYVAGRLLAAEAAKDGYIDATLLASSSSPRPDGDAAYTYAYELTTTRAHKVVVSRVAVRGGTLFTATGMAPCAKGGACDPQDGVLAALRAAVTSFEVE